MYGFIFGFPNAVVRCKTSKRHFAKRNNTALGYRIQMSMWIWHHHFLSKLKIVNNTPKIEKNQNKTSMAKAMGPFRYSQTPSWFLGPRTNVPTEPPYHRTWSGVTEEAIYLNWIFDIFLIYRFTSISQSGPFLIHELSSDL